MQLGGQQSQSPALSLLGKKWAHPVLIAWGALVSRMKGQTQTLRDAQ